MSVPLSEMLPTLPKLPEPPILRVREALRMDNVPLKLTLLPVKVKVVPLEVLSTNPPDALLSNVPA